MDEFRRKPVNRVSPQPVQPNTPVTPQPADQQQVTHRPVSPILSPQPLDTPVTPISPEKKKKSVKKRVILWLVGIVSIIVLALGGLFGWYMVQLSPVDSGNTDIKVVTVASGSAPSEIAALLKSEGVIRNETAFLWYTRIEGVQNNLQAGAYRLTPSESTQQIVEHLVAGRVDTFNVTLYPGATLVDTTDKAEDKKYDVTTALKRAGYTDEQITTGLNADYSSYNDTLFQGRPASADLEGYVFGETYQVAVDATVEDVLRTSFDHFWKIIEDNNLVAKYKEQGLDLYQGITLASIVQRESGGDDKPGIAQVFLTRLSIGQQLGSDVTYQYITDKLGVERDINFDSPYNTRRYTGLPPGPIASPGEKALIAVGSPASTDYIYFLSGDDDITYFARTYEEHEANIRNHCQTKCQIL